jgi:hypothetical protein
MITSSDTINAKTGSLPENGTGVGLIVESDAGVDGDVRGMLHGLTSSLQNERAERTERAVSDAEDESDAEDDGKNAINDDVENENDSESVPLTSNRAFSELVFMTVFITVVFGFGLMKVIENPFFFTVCVACWLIRFDLCVRAKTPDDAVKEATQGLITSFRSTIPTPPTIAERMTAIISLRPIIESLYNTHGDLLKLKAIDAVEDARVENSNAWTTRVVAVCDSGAVTDLDYVYVKLLCSPTGYRIEGVWKTNCKTISGVEEYLTS